MRQSSDFYLNMAKKQQGLLEKFKRNASCSSLWFQHKHTVKAEMSFPSLETKADEENPYQNVMQGKQI